MKRAADMTDDEINAILDNPPPRIGPYATAVRYAPSRDEIVLGLDTGVTLTVPRAAISELRLLPKAQLKQLELMGDGDAIALHGADVHISVRGLVGNLIGLDRARPAAHAKRRPHRKDSAA